MWNYFKFADKQFRKSFVCFIVPAAILFSVTILIEDFDTG